MDVQQSVYQGFRGSSRGHADSKPFQNERSQACRFLLLRGRTREKGVLMIVNGHSHVESETAGVGTARSQQSIGRLSPYPGYLERTAASAQTAMSSSDQYFEVQEVENDERKEGKCAAFAVFSLRNLMSTLCFLFLTYTSA